LDAQEAKEEIYEVTNLPALCEDEEGDPLGRKAGESLFPEKRGRKFLRKVKAALPSHEWRSQYMGDPRISLVGNFERENLQFITPDEIPDGLELVRGWDIALTEKQTSDYTAGCLAAYDAERDRLYIFDMFRTRRSWTKLRSVMVAQSHEDRTSLGVHRIGVESVAGFVAVAQDLRELLLGQVKVEARRPPRGGKLLRAQPWLNKIEAKRVFLVRGPWTKEFIYELESFPFGNNDDQVDAVSTAWEMLTGRARNGGRPRIKERPRVGVRQRSGSRMRRMEPA
jgi:predicted phage terminase large subunit-like protein